MINQTHFNNWKNKLLSRQLRLNSINKTEKSLNDDQYVMETYITYADKPSIDEVAPKLTCPILDYDILRTSKRMLLLLLLLYMICIICYYLFPPLLILLYNINVFTHPIRENL